MSDLYEKLTDTAKLYDELYHYTSIDTLKKILTNKSLLINHLSCVNDPEENKRITSIWENKVFVSCVTHTLKNEDYFFKKYGKVRIVLSNDLLTNDIYLDPNLKTKLLDFHKDFGSASSKIYDLYTDSKNWCVYNVSFSDVYYTDDLNKHKAIDGYESNAGLIKSKNGVDTSKNPCDWSIEEESRLRVAVRPIGYEYDFKRGSYPSPPFKRLFFSIEGKIKSIDACDCCSIEEKTEIKEIVDKYM